VFVVESRIDTVTLVGATGASEYTVTMGRHDHRNALHCMPNAYSTLKTAERIRQIKTNTIWRRTL